MRQALQETHSAQTASPSTPALVRGPSVALKEDPLHQAMWVSDYCSPHGCSEFFGWLVSLLGSRRTITTVLPSALLSEMVRIDAEYSGLTVR